MQELEVVKREWLLSADIASGDVPDIPKRYSKSITFRPSCIEIVIREWPETEDNPSEWSWDSITLYGLRVLRDGSLGAPVTEVFYSFQDLPSWADPIITRAMAITGSEPEF